MAAAAFIIVGAALGNPIGLAAAALAVVGLPVAAKILEKGVYKFGKALKKGIRSFAGMDPDRVVTIMQAISMATDAVIQFVRIGPRFIKFKFFGASKIVTKGVAAMVYLAVRTLSQLAKVVQVIDNIRIRDPKMFQMKMDAIGKLLEAVQGLAQLGLDAMMMATVASLFSDKGPEDMMKMMNQFITNTVDAIKNLVVKFVEMAAGMDEKALKGAQAISGIIGAIAALAGAMLKPMQDIVNNQSWYDTMKGDTASKKMSTMAAGIGSILIR